MSRWSTPTESQAIKWLAHALVLACVLTLAGSRAAGMTALAAEGPSAQLTDRLEGPGRSLLLALYSTELAEEGSYELEGVVHMLPCPHRSYRFVATDSSINESRASTSEAGIRVLSARFPPGIRCGVILPRDLVEGEANVKLAPIAHHGSLPVVYRDPGEGSTVESHGSCATLEEVCAGHYVLSASFENSGHRLTVRYDVVVIATKSQQSSRRSAAQCPIS